MLDGLDASFRAGTLVAVTGPSGSGKTTLLALLAGLRDPTTGEVVVARRAARRARPRAERALRGASTSRSSASRPGLDPVPERARERRARARAARARARTRPGERALDALDAVGLARAGGAARRRASRRASASASRSRARSPPGRGSSSPTSRPRGSTRRTLSRSARLFAPLRARARRRGRLRDARPARRRAGRRRCLRSSSRDCRRSCRAGARGDRRGWRARRSLKRSTKSRWTPARCVLRAARSFRRRRRQLRVDDASIRGAGLAGDEAGALEAVQQPRDPGRGQEDARGEIDASHRLLGRPARGVAEPRSR